ncbi:MAG: glycine-rich domain-containing protein [Candidatus Saccharibacteria bacterium]
MGNLTKKINKASIQRLNKPNTNLSHIASTGFTIIELLVVIIIIGILATVSFVAYGNTQQQARDKSLLTDMDNLDSIVTQYDVETNTQSKTWDSTTGNDSSLNFAPSGGNVIIVSRPNPAGYCIKAYNPGSSAHGSLSTAVTKETQAGSCSTVPPPVTLVYNPGGSGYTVPAGVSKATIEVWGAAGGVCRADMPGGGGWGGYAKGDLIVAQGDVLNVSVGSSGSDGYNSYTCAQTTDGGSSQVSRNAVVLLIGTGGGRGDYDTDGSPGAGAAYSPVTNISLVNTAYPVEGKVTITYTPAS